MTKILTTVFALAAFTGSAMTAEAAANPAKPKPYALDTCIVSGDKLGGMGEAVTVVREGREIKFCCKGCIKDFDKDPGKFIKKIEEAEKANPAGGNKEKAADSGHDAHHH